MYIYPQVHPDRSPDCIVHTIRTPFSHSLHVAADRLDFFPAGYYGPAGPETPRTRTITLPLASYNSG